MALSFYSSVRYKEKQRQNSRAAWERGRFAFLSKREMRICQCAGCSARFEVIPSNPKKYCSSRCAAQVSNRARGAHSLETKLKIAQSLTGTASPFRGAIKVPRIAVQCQNSACKRDFLRERWKQTRFCSVACAMHITGSQPTSPRAARAKAGIRPDINDSNYFYSRWEANLARILNRFEVKWIHQPRSFDLRGQKYTPDFYLPEYDLYIEVKNFLSPYSKNRDEKFRKLYPNLWLRLLLRDEYYLLEKKY